MKVMKLNEKEKEEFEILIQAIIESINIKTKELFSESTKQKAFAINLAVNVIGNLAIDSAESIHEKMRVALASMETLSKWYDQFFKFLLSDGKEKH